MKRLSTACVAALMLLTAVPPFGGGTPAQQRAAGAPAGECEGLLKQSTVLTNKYVYSATSAIRRDDFPTSEGGILTLKWDFIGVPNGPLTPDQTIRIEVKGALTTSLPNRNLEPPTPGPCGRKGSK